MPELTAPDLAVQIGVWLGQASPTLEFDTVARQEIALWASDNLATVAPLWGEYKQDLGTGVHSMAAWLEREAGLKRHHVIGGQLMRDGIAWLSKSGTPFCPGT